MTKLVEGRGKRIDQLFPSYKGGVPGYIYMNTTSIYRGLTCSRSTTTDDVRRHIFSGIPSTNGQSVFHKYMSSDSIGVFALYSRDL